MKKPRITVLFEGFRAKTKYGKIHTVYGIFYFAKYGTKLIMYRTVPPLIIID